MRLRKAQNQKLLLLKDGKLAKTARYCAYHIWCWTDGGQHPRCVEAKISDKSRSFTSAPVSTSKVSRAWTVGGYAGGFHLYGRWNSGHSPYPQIQDMAFHVFGIEFPMSPFPKAEDSKDDFTWKRICFVSIATDGSVFVNGRFAGIFEEFIEPQST